MVSENKNNELELIKKIALGDKSALLELYRRYGYILFNYARTYVDSDKDAEEVVQDVIYKIWEKAHTFDFNSFSQARGWILTICRNIAIDKIRKNKVSMVYLYEKNSSLIPDINFNIEDYVERKIVYDKVKSVMELLPSDQREIIELIYIKGFTQSQVAQTLNLSVNTVKSKIRLAMKKLRKWLKPNHEAGE